MSETHHKHPSTPARQDRRIFAFTGLPGVGKSAVAKEFASCAGDPIVNMGEEMKAQYQSLPVGDDRKETPENTWEMAQALRQKHGFIGPALACASRIAACFIESNVVIVDGVRNIAEVEYFREAFGCTVHTVAVTANEDVRADRFYERGDYDYDAMSESAQRVLAEQEMKERTEREVGAGLQDAIDYANYSIENSGSLHDAGMQCARLRDELNELL